MYSIENYQPNYVWPNPIIPFKVYFQHENLRIFIIVNITHNWEWLKAYHGKFRETDYFFVACGWHQNEYFARECDIIFELLSLSKENFYFLFNEPREMRYFTKWGFKGDAAASRR